VEDRCEPSNSNDRELQREHVLVGELQLTDFFVSKLHKLGSTPPHPGIIAHLLKRVKIINSRELNFLRRAVVSQQLFYRVLKMIWDNLRKLGIKRVLADLFRVVHRDLK
jgi:hypothetical protein